MTKKIQYRQCGLRKDFKNDSTSFQLSFIPATFARIKTVVRLKQADGEWQSSWQVVSVGVGIDEDHVPDSHRAIKSHRKHTGDSMRR
ncbi:MAG: hypothetical protein ACI87E_003756 [Mariniblastus sp.]|jgi:hypothetical protein